MTTSGAGGAKGWSGVSIGAGIDEWMVVVIIAPMSSPPSPPSPAAGPVGDGGIPVITGAGEAIGIAGLVSWL